MQACYRFIDVVTIMPARLCVPLRNLRALRDT